MNRTARRIIRRLAFAIATLAAMLVLVHTPPVRKAALALLESLSQRYLGLALEADALDYRLWRGEVRLRGIRAESGGVSAEASEVVATLPPFAPLRIEVSSPDVVITPGEGDAGPFVVPGALLGARVVVRDGRLVVPGVLEAESIDADLSPEGLESVAVVTVGTGVARQEALAIPFGPASARLRLRTSSLEIDEARVARGDSFVAVAGTLTALSPLEAELRFDHEILPDFFDGLLELAPKLEGPLAGDGTARKNAGSPWVVDGNLRPTTVALDDLEPLTVQTGWRLAEDRLELYSTEVAGYGGRALVDAAIDLRSEERIASGAFEDIDLRRLEPRIASRASGRFEATWQGWDFGTLVGNSTLTLRGSRVRGTARVRLEAGRLDARFRGSVPLAGIPSPVSGSVAVEGTARGAIDDVVVAARVSSEDLALYGESFHLDGGLRYRGSRLGIEALQIQRPDGGTLVIAGGVPVSEAGGAWEITASADGVDLAGLAPAPAAGLLTGTASVSGPFARPVLSAQLEIPDVSFGEDVSFSLRATAQIQGPYDSIEAEASLRAESIGVRGIAFPAIDVGIESDAGIARIEARFEDGKSLATAELSLGAPWDLEASIPLENLPVSEMRRLFPELEEANTHLDIAGEANIALALLEPAELEYRVEAERVLGTYRGIFLGASSPFSIEGNRNSFALTDLILIGEDTAIGIDGVLPLSRDGGVVLHARGAARLELLRPWFPDAEPGGRANIDLRVDGALPDPWLRGEIGIDDASVRVGGVLVDGVIARGGWSDEALRFEDVRGRILGGRFRLRGELPPHLDASAPTRLSFEVEDVDPLLLLPDGHSFEGAEAELAVSGVLEGVGFDPGGWRGRGALGWVMGRMNSIELKNDGPAPWSLADGRLELEGLVLSGGQGRLVVYGETRPFDEVPSWSANASGRIDHSISRVFLEDAGVSFEGATDLELRAGAGPEPFFLSGRGSFRDARIIVRDPAIVLGNVEGDIELDERAITLTRATAETGSGRIGASGRIDFSGERTEVDVRARAESIRLAYPEGLRSEIEGDLRLSGAPDSLRLSGDVSLARALFSRDIRLETEILQSLSRVERLSGTSSFASSVSLDLRVRAGEAFRIDNNLARMDASVNLAVRGTLAEPELHGLVAARPGGEFRFGGNAYRIENGRIQLRGYPAEPPVLDIRARTEVSGYDIQLDLRGPTDNLSTQLTSLGRPAGEPEPSQSDIASLLLTGRTLGQIPTESKKIVGEQMRSYLGASLAELAEVGLGEALPFDIVMVEPSLIAREADPAARFTLGARFADTLSLVYSIGLDNPDDQFWIVDWKLPHRTSTQLIRNNDNEFTAGLSQNLALDVRRRARAETADDRTIASVAVALLDGRSGVSEEELLKHVRAKPRHRYDYWKAWDEAERLAHYLRDRDYLEAMVDVAAHPDVEGGADRVALEFRVQVGPKVRFVFEGDEPNRSLKKAIRNLWNGSSSESFLTADAALLVEGRLFEDRYYSARADVEAWREPSEVVVTITLDRGPRGRRVEVDFLGNDSLADALLLRALPKTSSAAFHELLGTKRPRLKQALQVQYATHGFVEASIEDPDVSFDEGAGVLRVAIPVAEGRLFRVDGIELSGVAALNEADLRARLALREGAPFRVTSFVRDRSTIANYYREQGFSEVEVTSSVIDRPTGDLGARFVVREGPRVTVKDVSITGNVATRESVIRREMTLEPGEPVRPSALNEMQRKLYELGVFRSADVVVVEPPAFGEGESSRGLAIAVTESPDLEIDYGLRVGTDGSFQVQGDARAPNLFGRAHSAGIRALIGTDENIYRFNYRSPYLGRLRLITDFFLERKIEEEQATEDLFGFADRTWTVTGQQTRPFGEHLNLQWSFSFKRTVTEIDDPDDFGDLTLEQNRSLLSTSLIHDSRNNIIRPTGGNLWSVTLQGAPEALGSDLKFLKLFGQLQTFVPLAGGTVWAARYSLGAADSFGQRLTEDDRFQAGGPNSVRGFDQGSLGPVDPLLGIPIGGSGVLVLNQELRFPLFWRLRGVGFWDAGNAFETPSDIRLTDLRHSLGAGLRLELPFGLLRLDWAGALARKENEDPWKLIFSLGHAF